MFIRMPFYMAFLFIWLELVRVVGFPCSCACVRVCVSESAGGRRRVKTDKSCQLAVLPHNLLTAFLSSKKKNKEEEERFQFHHLSSDINELSKQ